MYNRYLYYECFTGKFTTFPIHTKLHPGTRVVYYSYSQKWGHFLHPFSLFSCLFVQTVGFYTIKRTLHYDLNIYEFYALNHSKIKFIYSLRRAISFNNWRLACARCTLFLFREGRGMYWHGSINKKFGQFLLSALEYKITSLYANKKF